MAELPNLGKHCSIEFCKQLDFLPFDCDGCGKTFCLQHQVKDVHQCSQHLLQKTSVTCTGPRAFSCAVERCAARELTPITCEHCHLTVCLGHRHQQDHSCTELKNTPVRNAQTAHHVAEILASRQQTSTKKTLKSAKSRKMAAQLALMKLKGKAEGDKGIPEQERVFFSVALPRALKQTSRALFFSKVWSIGRTIDFIADRTGVPNPNNTGAAQKLRLFSGDTGELMPVEKSLSELLEAERDLYNGSFVIMESVSQEVTCLPDVEIYKS